MVPVAVDELGIMYAMYACMFAHLYRLQGFMIRMT